MSGGAPAQAGPDAPDAEHVDPASVRSMFDGIARFYDLLNTVLSAGRDRGWRRAAADAAGLTQGATAVDVCTGTGRLARELRLRVGETGRVVGVDFSEGMIAVARRRVPGVDFRRGDATVLAGIEDGGADAVTIAFGLRNVPDRAAALGAAHRVLRPGGKLVVLEFGHVDACGVGRIYGWYLGRLLPRLGRLFNPHSGAYGYLAASITRYPDASTVSAWLGDAGFERVVVARLTLGIVTLHVATRREAVTVARDDDAGGPETARPPAPMGRRPRDRR